HRGADPPRVTHPSATGGRSLPSDLHVLGAPPAFVLSQDQTLHLSPVPEPTAGLRLLCCSEVRLDLTRTYANLTKPGTRPWLNVSRSSAFKEPTAPHSAGGQQT